MNIPNKLSSYEFLPQAMRNAANGKQLINWSHDSRYGTWMVETASKLTVGVNSIIIYSEKRNTK